MRIQETAERPFRQRKVHVLGKITRQPGDGDRIQLRHNYPRNRSMLIQHGPAAVPRLYRGGHLYEACIIPNTGECAHGSSRHGHLSGHKTAEGKPQDNH